MPPVPPGGRMTDLSADARRGFGPWDGYGPGEPLQSENRPVRVFDFPIGWNLQSRPRASEPFGFAELRAFANVELVRLAIETRKDQVERLDWRVRPKHERRLRGRVPRTPRSAAQEGRIKAIEAFLRKPDGVTLFAPWLRLLIEDLLVLDAPAIEMRRDRASRLVGMDVVPGDTITRLVDATGRTPLPPLPAYQQIIKGQVWADLTTRDLLYLPRNVRPGKMYGFSVVEQIIVTINTAMRRQAAQLAHFASGNTPPGLINAPQEWTPQQLKDYQDWFDARMKGQPDQRAGILWGPHGSKYQPFKDPPLKDDFDEWLARVVCYAFSLPPTPFIKQMNKSTSDNDQERSLTEGLEPLLLWIKRFLDDVIATEFGDPDLEFDWQTAADIDPKVQAEIDDTYLRNGSLLIDEVREGLGREPIPGGDAARIYTADGAIRIDQLDVHAEAKLTAMSQPRPGPNADPARDGDDKAQPAPKPKPQPAKE